jgi:hypothetical protein
MTQGMQRVEASPETMLAKLFGEGTLQLPAGAGDVYWKGTSGKMRLLGRMKDVAGEEVFLPSHGTKRLRNQVLGQIMVNQLEYDNGGHGSYGVWIKREATAVRGGSQRVRHQPMQHWPYGGSDPSDVGLQDRAAYGIRDEDLSRALQPRDGVTEGGLAVRFSQPVRGSDRLRERIRAIFYPRGKSSVRSTTFDRVAGLIFGVAPDGGGAVVERETVVRGDQELLRRPVSRREMRQRRGYVKQEINRWAELTRKASPHVALETSIAEKAWQVGAQEYLSDDPLPRVNEKAPPNLMLEVLFGSGRLRVAEGGTVTWDTREGAPVNLGRMVGAPGQRTFEPNATLRDTRDRYLGERILGRVLSTESKRVQWDTFRRFSLTVLSQTVGKVNDLPTAPPLAQTVEIRETDGHVLDTVSDLFPKQIHGVIRAPKPGRTIKLAWTSRELTIGDPGGGRQVAAPAGHLVRHEVILFRASDGGQRVRYSYRIEKE